MFLWSVALYIYKRLFLSEILYNIGVLQTVLVPLAGLPSLAFELSRFGTGCVIFLLWL